MPGHLFQSQLAPSFQALQGNRMLESIEKRDWSDCCFGAIHTWPEALCAATRMPLLSPQPMILLLGADSIVIFNDAAEALFGPPLTGALGHRIGQIFPDLEEVFAATMHACQQGRGAILPQQRFPTQRDGRETANWFDLSFTPVTGQTGEIFGALLTAADMTDSVIALRDLEVSRQRLALSLEHGAIVGAWEADLKRSEIRGDERFCLLHGLDPKSGRDGAPFATFILGVHPDDRKLVLKEFSAAMRSHGHYRLQHRVVADGEPRWVISSGRMFADENDELTQYFGVMVDITDQMQSTARLQESEAHLRALADTVPQIVFSADADGRSDYMNSRWFEYTGLGRVPITEDYWRQVIHPDDRERVNACWQHAVATGERYDVEFRSRHHSGQYRWMRAMALPHRDPDGKISRWFGTNTDIHDANMHAAERELVAGELDHRIKNLFALVSALIRMSRRDNTDVASFADALLKRLDMLYGAHELVRTRGAPHASQAGVSMQALLRRLLQPYLDNSAAIEIGGDDVTVRGSVVTPLALVFHELGTNAAKYGALGTPDGTLQLHLAHDDGIIRVRWTEVGAAYRESPTAGTSFGSRLLKLAVEGQLNGQMSLSAKDLGLVVDLTFPSTSLLA